MVGSEANVYDQGLGLVDDDVVGDGPILEAAKSVLEGHIACVCVSVCV